MGSKSPEGAAELRDALFADTELARDGITLFGASVDRARGTVRVRVAGRDPERVRACIQRRYGDRVDVEVVAASAYVIEDVPWQCWTDGGGSRLTVWLRDHTDGSKLRASHRESDEEVVITVSGPRWQGGHQEIGHIVRKDVELSRAVGGRRVIDAAAGEARPKRALVL